MLEREFGYKPPIPEDLQRQYEATLDGVLRWKNGNWADNVYETDMDHVAGMFVILEDLNRVCPTLPTDFNLETVQHMIYIHDGGEILVGDLTRNREDYHTVYDRWKNREHAAFRLLTTQITDEKIKQTARQLYTKCTSKKHDDKEALLTDFIDKLQGSRFGFRNVFNGRGMNKRTREMHFNRSVELMIPPIKPLLQLVTPPMQVGLLTFFGAELERFSRFGYRREAAPYIRNLDAILK